jgi:hypothetical protein
MKLGKHLDFYPAEFNKYSFIGSLDTVEEDSQDLYLFGVEHSARNKVVILKLTLV